MRPLSIAAGLMLIAMTPAVQARQEATPERMLAGRVAGKPISCIPQRQIDSSQNFDSGDILYRMKSGPDYLNSPRPKCAGLRGSAGMVTRTPSTDLCRGDIADIVDFTSGTQYGSCALGDFVPYPRVRKPRQ
jgi:hypothetical protein